MQFAPIFDTYQNSVIIGFWPCHENGLFMSLTSTNSLLISFGIHCRLKMGFVWFLGMVLAIPHLSELSEWSRTKMMMENVREGEFLVSIFFATKIDFIFPACRVSVGNDSSSPSPLPPPATSKPFGQPSAQLFASSIVGLSQQVRILFKATPTFFVKFNVITQFSGF